MQSVASVRVKNGLCVCPTHDGCGTDRAPTSVLVWFMIPNRLSFWLPVFELQISSRSLRKRSASCQGQVKFVELVAFVVDRAPTWRFFCRSPDDLHAFQRETRACVITCTQGATHGRLHADKMGPTRS